MGNLFHTISLVLLIISAAGVILLVLLQHGKGADMGAAFGSGSSGSLFGASGSANFLSRMTSVFATVFFLSTTALAFIAHPGDHGQRSGAGSSVMEGVEVPAPASSSVPAAPGESPAGAPAQPDNAVPQAPGQSGVRLPRHRRNRTTPCPMRRPAVHPLPLRMPPRPQLGQRRPARPVARPAAVPMARNRQTASNYPQGTRSSGAKYGYNVVHNASPGQ